MVCSEVASNYYTDFCKSKGHRCVITAIVPKTTFFHYPLFSTGAGTAYYFEYEFRYGDDFLFILKSTQQTNKVEIEET